MEAPDDTADGERITTGIDELDLILGGGLLAGSFVIVMGAPGTGKTILAQQACFASAKPEHRAIYYTTLSKSHTKLIRHLRAFNFFDEAALEQRVEFIDLAALVQSKGSDRLGPVVTEVVRRCFASDPSVVVIDSGKALRSFATDEEFREVVYELASRVAHTNAVLLFVGEYTPQQAEIDVEFPVADGIIHLVNERRGPMDHRWLRVMKMRGTAYLEGSHSFEITTDGLKVFPRLEATLSDSAPQPQRRISIGVPKFDEMMGGGIPETDTTLIVGQSGVGKTVLTLSFLARGLEDGERCLLVSLQEDAGQLTRKAASFGWDFAEARESGQLVISYQAPIELKLDAVGAAMKAEIARGGVKRVVLDGLQELVFAAGESERLPAFIRALTGLVRSAGASLIFTSETAALGPTPNPFGGLSFLFHNIVLLRFMERSSEVQRALGIHKMRDSGHEKGLIHFDIDEQGIRVLERLEDMKGLLGWTALRFD